MGTSSIRTCADYFKHVKGLIAATLQQRQMSNGEWVKGADQYSGTVKSPAGRFISFQDGATLMFRETVRIEQGTITREEYSFKYRCGNRGFPGEFRYEKDPTRECGIQHPLKHLQVTGSKLRFPTHETTFEEILEFISANCYG